jgi:hypothetical protein
VTDRYSFYRGHMSSSSVIRGPAGTVREPDVDEPNIVAPPPPEWLPAPPRRRRRAPQRHWTARVLTAPLLASGLVWPALLAGGVDGPQALRLALVVGVQTFGGALLWRLARGTTGPHLSELTGMGLGLGTLLSLLAQQALRVTSLDRQAWWLPTAAAVLLVVLLGLIPVTRPRLRLGSDERFGLEEIGSAGIGLAVGFEFLETFWRAHPLHWTGWWAYYTDIPYHEALATSVTTWGPGDNILAVGSPIRYHWFADAWAGTTTLAAGAGPFVVITRLLPVVALLGIVLLVWAWARRLSALPAVPLLAVVLTAVALNIGSARPVDLMHLLTLSPSLAMGSLWLLATALVLTEFAGGRLGWAALLLLAVLSVACVGGKTSNVPALLGGIGLAALASLFRPGARVRVWTAFGVLLIASGAAFVVLILGSSGNLTVQAGASAKALGVLPGGTLPGLVWGTLGAALVLATKWSGIAVLIATPGSRRRPEVWFAVGAALSGLTLMACLGHPGASQLYFPVSAGVLVTVVSAWGLGEALRRMSSAALGVSVVVGVVTGVVSVIIGSAAGSGHSGSRVASSTAPIGRPLVVLSHGLTWIAPYAVWTLPLLLVVCAAVRARMRRSRYLRGGLAGILAWSLVVGSIVVGTVGVVDAARAPGPTAPAPRSTLAWSDSQRAPLLWLRQHSGIDDVVATNRQCSAPQLPGQRCGAPQQWFLTAALSGRRMYVEGADYAISQPPPAWIAQRVALSRRFVDAPTVTDAGVLWHAGVRWVVVDLTSTHTRKWTGFAAPAYTTPTTVVLRLLQP